jgi:fibronectin-binding autotransporter adhesin
MAAPSPTLRSASVPSRCAGLAICCGLALTIGAAGTATAQTPITWSGTSGAQWATAGNWAGGTAPTSDTTTNSAVFTATTSGSVNVNSARSIAGLDIQRDVTFTGSTLTLGTASPTVNTTVTIAAGKTVTFNNQLNRTTGTFAMGDASTLTYNSAIPQGGTYNLTNATINFNGNVSHASNPDFFGTGTLNYGFSGTATAFRFNIRDSANLVIKATSGGDGGASGATYIRYYGPGSLTLERDFTMLSAASIGISLQNGGLAVQSTSAAIVTVAGGYTGRFNQLVFLPTANSTFRLDGSTLAIGDGTAGKVQGVFVGSTTGAAVSGTTRVYTLDATAIGGTVRVTGSSTFNNFVTGTVVNNQGAQLALTGPIALYNNGNWQNQNLSTTAVLTGIDVGASATLGGIGTFDMGAINGANAKNTLVSGTVAPGDPTLSGGIGTLTMNTGTMSFGSASTLRLDVGSGANNNDRLVINGIAAVTGGAALSFNASGLDQGKYTVATASSGLTGFASTNTPSAYRLAQSGTEITLFARAVQSVAGLAIGGTANLTRVMQNQSLAFTGTASNTNPTGGDALALSLAQLAGSNLSLSGLSTGSVASASSQQISGTVATGSTLGGRSWGLTNTDTTATVPTASGSSTVNVLDNRTVTAASVNFGVVRQTASGTQSFALTSSEADSQYTRITVGNGSGGGFSITGSSDFVFDGTANSSRGLSGTFSTAGTVSGTIALTNASAEGSTLQGQAPGTTSVAYSASVFDGAGSWNASGGGAWGSQASSNWTSTDGVQAAPGTFTGFANTDSATFGSVVSSGTATISLDGATVGLAALAFSNTNARYLIAKGTGSGSFTLSAASGKPTVSVLGTHEIATSIGGTGGLEKNGVGTLILSGSSNYSGDTDVSAGTLAVNGVLGGNVTVASGATLGGSGSIAGLVTVNGILSPGNSPGELTLGSLVLGGTSTTLMQIDGVARGTQYDGITITGSSSLTYGGALSLVFGNGSAFADNVTFDLFSFAGVASGNFSNVSSTGFYAGTWTNNNDGTYKLQQGPQTLTFSQATGDIIVVPEPGAVALASIGMALTGWSLSRRRRMAKIA